ncbi:MAG: trehalose-phosphatase [Phycisphaerales bacterium JB060]
MRFRASMTSETIDPAGLPPEVERAIDRLAEAPTLLIASDYDGTMAAIVDDPSAAQPDRNAVVALRALSELPHTHAAVISGRSLEALAGFLPGIGGVHLVGSHGSEFDAGFVEALGSQERALLAELRESAAGIADAHPGVHIESKPASVCVHVRQAEPQVAEAACRAVLEGPATLEGVFLKRGKRVLELCVVDTNKGRALARIRERVGASHCVFLGDDVTDEDAFALLCGPDVGVKVGPGETAAGLRLDDQESVAHFLAALLERRSRWVRGGAVVPIEHHAMLSDQRTIALLTPDARLTWLCLPRIDSPALFAHLLGGDSAGYWSVTPLPCPGPASQRYEGDTMTVATMWDTVTVRDLLDCSQGRPHQPPGRSDLIRVIEGHGRVWIVFAPRHDFGRIATGLRPREGGLDVLGTHDRVVLRSPGVRWHIEPHGQHETASAEVDLDAHDGPLVLELRFGTASLAPGGAVGARRDETDAFWRAWAGRLRVPGAHAQAVRRSALLIRGLCHGPTGAIAAAGTTSLPEWIGGVRNWDYRYCWPRDATMAAASLVRLGSTAEALRLLDWLRVVIEALPDAEALAPLYAVGGEAIGPEAQIAELAGYAGSRPVRVGNAAAHQLQLDVYAPIVDLVALLGEAGAPLSPWHGWLARSLAETAARCWQDPDHGIWEPRTPPTHNVHTKVMCWMTIRRAMDVAKAMGDAPPEHFEPTARAIRQQVLERGWDPRAGAFTAMYGGAGVDAATLWTGLSGMLAPDDERFVATVDNVRRRLLRGGSVHRYYHDDGLPGEEGGFNLCTSWLIESLALIGRASEAAELFERYLALAGPCGLLAEEHDPAENRALGNVPQAYSHLGLINAALRLDARDAPISSP